MNDNFEEKVKKSFVKAKEDMEFLRQEVNKVKKFLLLKNNEISDLKSQIKALNDLISSKIEQIRVSSTGNDGAITHHHSSSSIIINDLSTEENLDKNSQKPLRMLIENKFRSLTDMEFAIFITIYQLEEEFGKVTYQDIAKKFNLTEATVRNHITNLINKNVPIDKERSFNKKTVFYINKSFRELNIASKILELRQQNTKTPSVNPKNAQNLD
ncbi:MAG: helix-turn-helix domain-containing protein [Nanoarchaeota archaeon]